MIGARFAQFFRVRMKSLDNQTDFDSAIPRFESWRPSQTKPPSITDPRHDNPAVPIEHQRMLSAVAYLTPSSVAPRYRRITGAEFQSKEHFDDQAYSRCRRGPLDLRQPRSRRPVGSTRELL